jgi:hypothetical protein
MADVIERVQYLTDLTESLDAKARRDSLPPGLVTKRKAEYRLAVELVADEIGVKDEMLKALVERHLSR